MQPSVLLRIITLITTCFDLFVIVRYYKKVLSTKNNSKFLLIAIMFFIIIATFFLIDNSTYDVAQPIYTSTLSIAILPFFTSRKSVKFINYVLTVTASFISTVAIIPVMLLVNEHFEETFVLIISVTIIHIVFFLIIEIILKFLRYKTQNLPIGAILLSVLVPITSIIILLILSYMIAVATSEVLLICIFSIIILLAVFNIINFAVINQFYYFAKKSEENILFKKQLEIQVIQYNNLHENYISTKRFRHDIKHYIFLFKTLCKNKDYDNLEENIHQISSYIDEIDYEIITGNSVIDATLNYEKTLAEKEHIDFNCDLTIPKDLKIPTDKITIFLINALNNAIEACVLQAKSDKRYINFKMYYQKPQLYIEITNSCTEISSATFLENKTSKFDNINHGYGMKSIEWAVLEMGGIFNVDAKESEFCLSAYIDTDQFQH